MKCSLVVPISFLLWGGTCLKSMVYLLQVSTCRMFFSPRILTKRQNAFIWDLKLGPELCLQEFMESSASMWPCWLLFVDRIRTAILCLCLVSPHWPRRCSFTLRRRASPVSGWREESETVPGTVSPSCSARHLAQRFWSCQGLPLVCCWQGMLSSGPQCAESFTNFQVFFPNISI